jgi:hypothetical protein
MSPVLRAALVFAPASVLAMLAFSLTPGEYAALGPFGKVNVYLVPVLLALGVLYDYRITLDKVANTAEVTGGLVFLHRSQVFRLDQVQKLVIRVVSPGKGGETEDGLPATGLRRSRAFIGFIIAGKLIVLDRACPARTARGWVLAFRAFMPFSVEEGE